MFTLHALSPLAVDKEEGMFVGGEEDDDLDNEYKGPPVLHHTQGKSHPWRHMEVSPHVDDEIAHEKFPQQVGIVPHRLHSSISVWFTGCLSMCECHRTSMTRLLTISFPNSVVSFPPDPSAQ